MGKVSGERRGITVHEGPRADSQGTGWREDAVRLEEQNQRMIENPMQTLPNTQTTLDKAQGARAKSDEGSSVNPQDRAGGSHRNR